MYRSGFTIDACGGSGDPSEVGRPSEDAIEYVGEGGPGPSEP
jgi:hypothetical protein